MLKKVFMVIMLAFPAIINAQATANLPSISPTAFTLNTTIGTIGFQNVSVDFVSSRHYQKMLTFNKFYNSPPPSKSPTPSASSSINPAAAVYVRTVPSPVSSAKPIASSYTSAPVSRRPTYNPTRAPSSNPTRAPSSNHPSLRPTIRTTTAVHLNHLEVETINSGVATSAISILSTSTSPTKFPTANPSSSRPSPTPSQSPTYVVSARPSIYNISYHPKNPVLTGNVKLYNIYYGKLDSGANSNTRSLVDYFTANVGNSSWYKTVSHSYYQINKDNSTTYASRNLTFVKSINVNSGLTAATAKTPLNDTVLIQSIVNAFNSQKLPIDTNAVYSVIFRGDLTYSGWLTNWCGFHSSFVLNTGQVIKYLVAGNINPVLSAGSNNGLQCAEFISGSANNNPGADGIASVYGHELAEVITDWNKAWHRDSDQNEVADVCIWDFGVDLTTTNWNVNIGSKQFLVQNIWRPGHGCVHNFN